MKCTLQKPKAQWTHYGARAAALGMSLEVVTTGLKYPVAREWAAEGYNAQIKRMERKARLAAK